MEFKKTDKPPSNFAIYEEREENIIALVYAAIMVIFITWIMVSIYTFTILFRPMPLASIENIPQNYVIIATLIVTLLTALTSQLGAEFTIPSICVSALAYFVSLIILFRYGTFVSEFNQKLIFMGCVGGGIKCVGCGTFGFASDKLSFFAN